MLAEMQNELGSVQDVIKFTKENIDALNQRFCKVKPGKEKFFNTTNFSHSSFFIFSTENLLGGI